MTLRVKPKKVERMVHLLKQPDAQYVSIVDHGANQTPFSTLKRVNRQGVTPMSRKAVRRLAKPTNKKASADQTVAVRKLVFDPEVFPKLKAVKAWLEGNDWENYTITDGENGFEAAAKNVTDDDFDGEIRTVDTEEGVTAHVGTPKTASDEDDEGRSTGKATSVDNEATDDDDDDDEDTASEDKSSHGKKPKKKAVKTEGTKKFDYWGAFLSGADDVGGVLEDAMKDGVPPGFDEIVFATTTAMANALKGAKDDGSDLQERLVKAGQDMGNIVFGIHKAFEAVFADLDEDDETQKAATPAHKAWVKRLDELSAEAKAKAEKALLGVGDDDDDEGDGDDAVQTSATDNDAITSMFKTVTDAVASIATDVRSLSEKVDDAMETANKASDTAQDAATRAKAAEDRAPTKKGLVADTTEDEGTSVAELSEKDADAKLTHRLNRSRFGLG